MPDEFDVDAAVVEFRRVMDLVGNPSLSATETKRLEKRASELRADYKAWNGDDELFEIVYGYPEAYE